MKINEKNLLAIGFKRVNLDSIWGKNFEMTSNGYKFFFQISDSGEIQFYMPDEAIRYHHISTVKEMFGLIAEFYIKFGKNKKIEELNEVLQIEK